MRLELARAASHRHPADQVAVLCEACPRLPLAWDYPSQIPREELFIASP
jgi:hypothetical protein